MHSTDSAGSATARHTMGSTAAADSPVETVSKTAETVIRCFGALPVRYSCLDCGYGLAAF